jgi:hypothetical protein
MSFLSVLFVNIYISGIYPLMVVIVSDTVALSAIPIHYLMSFGPLLTPDQWLQICMKLNTVFHINSDHEGSLASSG